MALIELREVTKRYPPTTRGGSPITAVDSVSLDIEAGSISGIIGYSGAGKSTLVRLINALEPVTEGTISIDGEDITAMPERRVREVRAGIGMIFQQFNLFSSRSIAGNVEYPLQVAKVPRAERAARVAELLEYVGLADKAKARPDELSGGQKQRVGIARALATKPRILLADEATSALDPRTTGEVLDLLARANEELGITIIVITHEMDVVQRLANRVAVMEQGRVVEEGDVFDVFSRPQQPGTQRFVATVVDGIPSGVALEELRRRHSGRLATVSFRDGDVDQRALFRRFAEAAVDVELVSGGVAEIQGRTFGNLTFALDGAPATIEEVLRGLGSIAQVTDLGAGAAAGAPAPGDSQPDNSQRDDQDGALR